MESVHVHGVMALKWALGEDTATLADISEEVVCEGRWVWLVENAKHVTKQKKNPGQLSN